MARKIIDNGDFAFDPNAESNRDAFGKTNENFEEIYNTIPQVDPNLLQGQAGKVLRVNSLENFFELSDVQGGGGDSLPVDDTTSVVRNFSDNTKQVRIDAGGISPGNVRALIMPDEDVNLGNFIESSDVASATVDVSENEVAKNTILNNNLNQLDKGVFSASSTGILSGGNINSLGGGVVRIDQGTGQIVDTSDAQNINYFNVSWPDTELDLSGENGSVFIFVDQSGNVQFDNTLPNEGAFFSRIYLWSAGVIGGVFLGAQPSICPSQNVAAGLRTLWSIIGASKKGLDVVNIDNDLSISFLQGTVFFKGIGFFDNPSTPDQITIPQNNSVTFLHVLRDGTTSAPTTQLDVSNFDSNGVLTPVPGAATRTTIIQLHAFLPGGAFRFLRGQEVFNSIEEAQSALFSGLYSPVVPATLEGTIILGWAIVQKGATNLSDGVQVLSTSELNQNISIKGGGSGITQDVFTQISQNGNNGFGTVFRQNNPGNYGDIGNGAVDLSFSNGLSTTNGATGDNSFAVGPNAKASGNESDAIGSNSETFSNNEVNIGPFPATYIPAGDDGDRSFNISTGTDDANRRNSLTILKDGRAGVGFDNFEQTNETSSLQVNGLAHSNATPTDIQGGTDGTLVTKGFLNSNLFESDAGTTGLLITTDQNTDYPATEIKWSWARAGDMVTFSAKTRQISGTTQTGRLEMDIKDTTIPFPSLGNEVFDIVMPAVILATSPDTPPFRSTYATFIRNRIRFVISTPDQEANTGQSLQNVDFNQANTVVSVSGSYRTTKKIGVAMAGQSNMSGRAPLEAQDTVIDPKVFNLDKEFTLNLVTSPAVEPTHSEYEAIAGVSPGLAFGKAVSVNLAANEELLLMPTAIGGTTVSNWLNDDFVRGVQLLTNFTERIREAQSLGVEIKAIMWHQGEGDAQDPVAAPLYGAREASLFALFRSIVGDPNLIIISGQLKGFTTVTPAEADVINVQKAANAAADPNVFLTDSSDFTDIDGLHFDAASNRLMGQRMAAVFNTEVLGV